jgi:diadenosine tetraphosphate (Ap4A) HIT family hydrolase
MAWPQSFFDLRLGKGCPICAEGRPEDNGFGIRVLAGRFADAYLQRRSVQRGYVVVIWRGRHIVEPTELSEEESGSFCAEVLLVGQAVESYYKPLQLNYLIAGNTLPHLHAHVVPRFEANDPNPGGPFPFPKTEPPPFPEDQLQEEARALRSLLADA